jgi:hypothetical protein
VRERLAYFRSARPVPPSVHLGRPVATAEAGEDLPVGTQGDSQGSGFP